MNFSGLPNLITIIRILLVLPLAWAIWAQHYTMALAVFAIAALSDGIDGFLARRFGWISPLGSALDPIADKLLLVSCYLLLGVQGHLPAWLVVAVVARDVIIVSGALAYRLLVEPPTMAPSFISKTNTVLQVVLLAAVFLTLGLALAPQSILLEWLAYLVLLTTLLSGLDYVATWGRRAWRARTGP